MISRRNEQVMLGLILQIADEDERIRAVIMNGSRASPAVTPGFFSGL